MLSNIAVASDPDGYEGMAFCRWTADIIEKKALDDHSIDKDEIEMSVKEMTPKAINNVTVMVIEDDPDMLEQIKSSSDLSCSRCLYRCIKCKKICLLCNI